MPFKQQRQKFLSIERTSFRNKTFLFLELLTSTYTTKRFSLLLNKKVVQSPGAIPHPRTLLSAEQVALTVPVPEA